MLYLDTEMFFYFTLHFHLSFFRPKQKWKPPKKAKKDEGGSSSKKRRIDLHQPEMPLSKEQLSMDEAFALQLLRGK